MLLESKNALVFAATGAVGGAVARTFASEGARIWLSGRDAGALETLAGEIAANGGAAAWEVVDATDPEAVAAHVERVAGEAGGIDVVFNAIGGRPESLGYPEPSATQTLDRFLAPLRVILGSTFLTARTGGERMARQGGGAIVTLSATLSGMTAANMAGISATCGAIEALTRSLAGELGPAGVRVNCLRASAMPETRTIQETFAGQARIAGSLPEMALPPLGRPITLADTARAAAFLASDHAGGMTGQVMTVCAGQFVG